MPTTGTKPTQIRLTDEDRAALAEIRQRFGLPSMASAIRYAIETTRMIAKAETVRISVREKKSRKRT
jgi:hypothetical protein